MHLLFLFVLVGLRLLLLFCFGHCWWSMLWAVMVVVVVAVVDAGVLFWRGVQGGCFRFGRWNIFWGVWGCFYVAIQFPSAIVSSFCLFCCVRVVSWPRFHQEKSAQRLAKRKIGDGYPAEIQGSFARISRPKTSVRALKVLENKHLGADIHDPKARTSTTLRDFQQLRSEKLWAEFSFSISGTSMHNSLFQWKCWALSSMLTQGEEFLGAALRVPRNWMESSAVISESVCEGIGVTIADEVWLVKVCLWCTIRNVWRQVYWLCTNGENGWNACKTREDPRIKLAVSQRLASTWAKISVKQGGETPINGTVSRGHTSSLGLSAHREYSGCEDRRGRGTPLVQGRGSFLVHKNTMTPAPVYRLASTWAKTSVK